MELPVCEEIKKEQQCEYQRVSKKKNLRHPWLHHWWSASRLTGDKEYQRTQWQRHVTMPGILCASAVVTNAFM